MEKRPQDRPWTMSIPEAGHYYYGLSPSASYKAANRGALITIDTGTKKRRVNVRAMERMLEDGGANAQSA